jgi:hypothetical protein
LDETAASSDKAAKHAIRRALANREITSLNSKLLAPERGPGILGREFHGGFKFNKSGSPIPASAREDKMANDRIVKAMRSLSDPNRLDQVKRNLLARNGGKMPQVGW